MQFSHADDNLTSDYWRRSRRYRRTSLLVFGAGVLVIGVAQWLLPERYVIAGIVPLVFVIFTIGMIVSAIVWRCPRCKRPFTRAHRPPLCEHCGTEFGLESK